MGLIYRKAKRSSAKPLFGIYGESGTGKTYSALLLARGFVGPAGKITMMETESGRGEIYANTIPGGYEVISITDNFAPSVYGEAITMAEEKKTNALIIDSGSHEWEGIGGVLDMADQNKRAKKPGMLVWQKPKMDHQKHFIGRLLQTPIDLVILCMRAKYPMEETYNEKKRKKEWVRSTVLHPIQDERILFEMMNHGWIDHDHKFHGQKFALPAVKNILSAEKPISIETGQALALWARGEEPKSEGGWGDQTEALLAGIASSQTMTELESVGAEIQKAKLSKAEMTKLRGEYLEQMKSMEGLVPPTKEKTQ